MYSTSDINNKSFVKTMVDMFQKKELTRSSKSSLNTCENSSKSTLNNLTAVINSPEKPNNQIGFSTKNDQFCSEGENEWTADVEKKIIMLSEQKNNQLGKLYEDNIDVYYGVINNLIIPALSNGGNWKDLVDKYQISDDRHYDSNGVSLYEFLQAESSDFFINDIKTGANIQDIIEKYSISYASVINEMESTSIASVARKMKEDGYSTTEVANKYGITSPWAITYLDKLDPSSINEAKKEIASGDMKKWRSIVDNKNIVSSEIRHRFQRMAYLEAMKKVMKGDDAGKVIAEYDIDDKNYVKNLEAKSDNIRLKEKSPSGSISSESQKEICQRKIIPELNSGIKLSETMKDYLDKNGVSASILQRSLSAETRSKLTSDTLKQIESCAYQETKEIVIKSLSDSNIKHKAKHAINILDRNKITNIKHRVDVLQCVQTYLNGRADVNNFQKDIKLLMNHYTELNLQEVNKRLNGSFAG